MGDPHLLNTIYCEESYHEKQPAHHTLRLPGLPRSRRAPGEGAAPPDQPADERDEPPAEAAVCRVPGSADGAWWDYEDGGDYGLGSEDNTKGVRRVNDRF
jgi:hypothetical protein